MITGRVDDVGHDGDDAGVLRAGVRPGMDGQLLRGVVTGEVDAEDRAAIQTQCLVVRRGVDERRRGGDRTAVVAVLADVGDDVIAQHGDAGRVDEGRDRAIDDRVFEGECHRTTERHDSCEQGCKGQTEHLHNGVSFCLSRLAQVTHYVTPTLPTLQVYRVEHSHELSQSIRALFCYTVRLTF